MEFEQPFYHLVIDNFLYQEKYDRAVEMYEKQQFKELKTDLFNFLQTNELKNQMGYFTEEIEKVLGDKVKNDMYWTTFASYYRKNDYLLCHDDCVDNREYAFSYYLDDIDTGELILYNDDCLTENKRVKIVKNRLVIFKVSEISFHEVIRCNKDGRKAFTGWLYSKNRSLKCKNFNTQLYIPDVLYDCDLPIDTMVFDIDEYENKDEFDINLQNKFIQADLNGFIEKEIARELIGPFVDRRTYRINVEEFVVFNIEGFELIHAEFIMVDINSYILCNDVINQIEESVFDGFLFRDDYTDLIHYVDPKTKQIEFSHSAVKDILLFGKRENKKIYVKGTDKQVKFYHMIYRKLS